MKEKTKRIISCLDNYTDIRCVIDVIHDDSKIIPVEYPTDIIILSPNDIRNTLGHSPKYLYEIQSIQYRPKYPNMDFFEVRTFVTKNESSYDTAFVNTCIEILDNELNGTIYGVRCLNGLVYLTLAPGNDMLNRNDIYSIINMIEITAKSLRLRLMRRGYDC